MKHSNQVREFVITDQGVKLLDVNIGPTGILTGSARLAYQIEQRERAISRQDEIDKKARELDRRRKILEATIANLYTEFESVEEELKQRKRPESEGAGNHNGKRVHGKGHKLNKAKEKKSK
jgi:circadian clock protein KaiC